jgi:dihydroorotate dehydrogenase
MSAYSLIKPLLFRLDPERVHDSVLRQLALLQRTAGGRALLRALAGRRPAAPVHTMGLSFPHPLGMAAGFDKNAEVVPAMQSLGFSHIEIGTVTPQPQPGNDKPRIWRFPESTALVNALGFPGLGMTVVGANLNVLRESARVRVPLGINIGKNADTPAERAVDDYVAVLEHLYEFGDYFAVNVSSPNTGGLRDLQAVNNLRPLLGELQNRSVKRGHKPLLVKIAPDLADDDVIAIADLVREFELAGIIAGNTTIRRDLVARAASLPRGGLSGAPLFSRTLQLAKLIRPRLHSRQTLISVGGVHTSAQVRDLLAAGANLVQVYTALIYHGPSCVRRLLS